LLIRFLVKRTLQALLAMLGVSTLTFLAVHVTAGNYVPGLDLAGAIQPGDLERLRQNLGLDRPLYVQYLSWLFDLLRGNFGYSMIDGTSISSNIAARLPNTLELSVTAISLGVLLAIPIGVVGALNRGTALDRILSVVSVAGFAVPQFWIGLMLILGFSVWLHSLGLPSLPTGGAYDPLSNGGFFDGLLDRAAHLVLPTVVLAFVYISIWSRYTRSSMISVLATDYVRTARAKGMTERRVHYVHALRNAVMPIVTLVALELPRLVSGSLVVEVIFSWPGLGRYVYQSALEYDYPAVLGVTTFVALLVVFGNMLADLVYVLLDPRVRLS
jgi:peptide/nickel transport system permease protein